MIELQKVKKYSKKFSVIGVGSNKRPSHKWKSSQTKKLDWKDLEPILSRSDNFGIVTGFEDLECIDVDLKVLKTAKERKEFWEEYLSILKDSILNFLDKVVIYKTKNEGYHIIYRCKKIDNNLNQLNSGLYNINENIEKNLNKDKYYKLIEDFSDFLLNLKRGSIDVESLEKSNSERKFKIREGNVFEHYLLGKSKIVKNDKSEFYVKTKYGLFKFRKL